MHLTKKTNTMVSRPLYTQANNLDHIIKGVST